MKAALLREAARLSDRDLLRRVTALAGRERGATVELIAHLAELDRRRLYRGEGFASTFSYCTDALRLAEHAAYKRIVAARACRRFPSLLDRLADGALNLSTLRLIAPHLTPENLEVVVAEAAGRKKREVEALVARLAPKPDVPGSVRKLPVCAVAPQPVPVSAPPTSSEPPRTTLAVSRHPSAALPAEAAAYAPGAATPIGPAALAPAAEPPLPPLPAAPARPPDIVEPLSPERYRIQFTIDQETRDTLRQLQDLLRRDVPDGDLGAIVARALALLLEDTARKKLAATPNPRPGRGRPDLRSRHLPAQLVRAVWKRDGGRCAFVARNGRRCTERTFLEFHHMDAHALGGETTVDNVSLRCRAHNQYEAELLFGPYELRGREAHAIRTPTNGP